MSDKVQHVKNALKGIGTSTGKAYQTTKTKWEINSLQKKVEKLAIELGRLTIEAHEQGHHTLSLIKPEMVRLLDEITLYKTKSQGLKQTLQIEKENQA